MEMTGNKFLDLLIIIMIIFILPNNVYCSARKAAGRQGTIPTNASSSSVHRPRVDVFLGDKCREPEEDADRFLFTKVGGASKCLLLKSEDDIPDMEKGERTFGESCALHENKCKRYVRTQVRINATASYDCMKPTHLICDPRRRLCVCSNGDTITSETRFQFGTQHDTGVNLTHGRCLIRPTFEILPGFDCSPGTKEVRLFVDESKEPISICACEHPDELDKFDTSDHNWWKCNKGHYLIMSQQLVAVVLWIQLLLKCWIIK